MSCKQFSIFVKNHCNKNHTIMIPSPIEEVSVDYFKTLVQKVLDVPPEQQQLIFSAKQLKDGTMMADYDGLGPNSTVYLLIRFHGGSSDVLSSLKPFPIGIPQEKDKCSICYSSPSVKMPCGDLFCPPCIISNTNDAINKKKTEILCSLCGKRWELSVIRKYASVSSEEMNELTKKLSEIYIERNQHARDCSGCGHYCTPMNEAKNRVYCPICAKENKTAEYCFNCSRPWKNPPSNTDCGNEGCYMDAEILHSAPKKIIGGVECTSYRLCPNCSAKIAHKQDCKHIVCPTCNTEFCFICLSLKKNDVWLCGSYDDPCVPAPVQLPAPVKNDQTDKPVRAKAKSDSCASTISSSTESSCMVM